jgi:hypothetical protein
MICSGNRCSLHCFFLVAPFDLVGGLLMVAHYDVVSYCRKLKRETAFMVMSRMPVFIFYHFDFCILFVVKC